MEWRLNKRLLPPAIVLLSAFNILPFGLLGVKNIDPLKLVSVCIFFSAAIGVGHLLHRDWRSVGFFLLGMFIATVNMVLKGKYMDWTVFYCFNYLNFFVLLIAFKTDRDITEYIQLVAVFCLVAAVEHFVFFLYPSLLVGKLNEIRMGSLNFGASKIRIFIPGMGFIAAIFACLIGKLLYYRKLMPFEWMQVVIFFGSIFIFSSVRTYLLGVFVAIVVLVLAGKLPVKRLLLFSGMVAFLLTLVSVVSEDIGGFITDRFSIFGKLADFDLVDAVRLDVDYDNATTWGTIYFRIMEVVFVLNNYSGTWREILFGNIGTLYDFLGVLMEPAPHVSIAGIYYLFGLTGLIPFCWMIWHYSRKIIRNCYRFKNTAYNYLTIEIAILWFSLIAFSFFGGIYYAELILLVTYCMAATYFLEKNPHYVGAEV